MRKDGKSSFQAKKEKLLEIKKLLLELKNEIEYKAIKLIKTNAKNYAQELREIENTYYYNKIGKIWEIVKDEK